MDTHSTNYYNTLIEASDDSVAIQGRIPPTNGEFLSVANIQFELISKHPYEYTSDDVVFLTFAYRNDLMEREMATARKQFFSKGQACLRCSPLCKSYGWGIHHNHEGKVALIEVCSEEYKLFLLDSAIKKVKAMRISRKKIIY